MNNNTNYEFHKCIKESIGPGNYRLNQPLVKGCYPPSTSVRIQKQNWYQNGGNSVYSNLVDVNSELKNITRNNTKCPKNKYIPQCNLNNCQCRFGYPCGSGVMNDCNNEGKRCNDNNMYIPPDCDNDFIKTNYTRLNNPCDLKEIGINRWQWLCKNPQNNVFVPFDYHINTRTLTKDNHRPCIPNPSADYHQYNFDMNNF